jgi:hypothetical protein
MSDIAMRKYLMFCRKNMVKKTEALVRMAKVHGLNHTEYKKACAVADQVYG